VDTGTFLGVNQLGCGINYLAPPSADVKGRVQLYLYSPSVPSWQVIGKTLLLPLPFLLFNDVGGTV
jgi:hypothetical protein